MEVCFVQGIMDIQIDLSLLLFPLLFSSLDSIFHINFTLTLHDQFYMIMMTPCVVCSRRTEGDRGMCWYRGGKNGGEEKKTVKDNDDGSGNGKKKSGWE